MDFCEFVFSDLVPSILELQEASADWDQVSNSAHGELSFFGDAATAGFFFLLVSGLLSLAFSAAFDVFGCVSQNPPVFNTSAGLFVSSVKNRFLVNRADRKVKYLMENYFNSSIYALSGFLFFCWAFAPS